MEPLYQEYLTNHGTVVKPYYWLALTLDCSKCPYHIRTGEEARVTHTEFYQLFGFPCGPSPQTKHLTFYELKTSSGSLVQKGQASSCTEYDTHPESMLFEMGSYLESLIHNNDNGGQILLYSNYCPCNEASHCCISKIYNFLMRYPEVSLNIYFSQLYHTETDFPVSAWNREALRSLASLWPQVTLNPISGRIWHYLLYHFVSGVSGAILYQPIWPARALADRHNAYEIKAITGVKPYFTDVLPQTTVNPNTKAQLDLQRCPLSNVFPQESFQVMNNQLPPMMMTPEQKMPVIFMLMPFGEQQPFSIGQNPPKPKNIVRHLNVPQMLLNETKDPRRPPAGRLVETVEIIEQFSDTKEERKKKMKKVNTHF
ncbi:putative C-_U-editing enzyme APOBEC-4 [Gracilinanus agilis]|uniref:putative C->U-editing enzyme APOBEC-4 n=1 Tax=Gracilinanus agilis TaxID=191870 RepID=UPI001CFF4C94|nr:putative C->U-editing enzyme APOBEC-4 [Gracilinanus agilis]